MADVNIDMLLSDSTRSIGRRRREVQALNQELERTRGLMSSQASGGGGGERESYDRARGAVGTGAAGRDFANQAQGLGGVVRLYATFAANIFAVGAAFQNLQQAANFERLINASKMMSARVGTDLLGLGKRLQEATGFAISFEDAMQFANLGTSAGIAANQLESLVTIAKGAAVGLGRDVNDAVRRIVQGTAKQEQEILDELGIFIKAKKAYDDYAKKFQISGGADALSAQQRVAAYADAVEQAGGKWKEFATLDDPFSRFVATGKEALTEILNFINKGIKPLLGFLADSKGAVIALALAISGMLAKRALPELKNLAVDLFTFSSARAKAQAEQQRVEIATRMATIANTIQTEQAKLAALAPVTQALTMQAVTATLPPGMLARTGASGQAVGPGIAPKKLEQAIFGRPGSPIDLASYTKAEELEKKYRDAVQQTVKTSQAKLDQMIQLGVLQNTSTLNELKLSDAVKRSSAEMFAKIQQYNAGLITRVELEQAIVRLQQEQVGLAGRLQASTPGQVRASGSYWQGIPTAPAAGPGFTGPPRPAAQGPQPAAPGGLAVGMAGVATGFTAGTGLVGDIAARMGDVTGGGMKVKLQQFTQNLSDMARGFTMVQGTAAKAGVAVGIMGTLISGAFSGIMAAFGPLMIIWTLWELFGKKMFPSIQASEELAEKQKALKETMGLTGEALERVTKLQNSATYSIDEYAQATDIATNAINSQIQALDALLEKKDKQRGLELQKEARKRAAKQGEAFSEEEYAVSNLLKSGMYDPKLKGELQSIRFEFEEIANSTENVGERTDINRRKLQAVLKENRSYLENLRSEQAQIKSNNKAWEDAIGNIDKKLKGIPKFGEIARSEEARVFAKILDDMFKPTTRPEEMQAKVASVEQALKDLASRGIPEAVYALAIFDEQLNKGGIKGLFEYLKTNNNLLPSVIGSINRATADYTDSAVAGFRKATAEIEKTKQQIMLLDIEIAKTNAFTARTQALRGFATDAEIATKYQQQLNKANLEYARGMKEVNLELDKALLKRGAVQGSGGDPRARGTGQISAEAQEAKDRAGFRSEELRIQLEQSTVSAKIQKENDILAATISKISIEYESINRKVEIQNAILKGNLDYETARLRILREANALPEPVLVEKEAQQEQQNLVNTYNEQVAAAKRAREESNKKASAEYTAATNLALLTKDQSLYLQQVADAREAYRTAQQTSIDKETDAIRLAQINLQAAQRNLQLNTEVKKIYGEAAEEAKKLAQQEALKQEQFNTETQLLDILKQELDLKRDMGMITEEAYNKEIRALEKNMRAREFNNKQLEIERNYKREMARIDTAEKAATAISLVEDRDGNKILDPQQQAEFDRKRTAAGLLRSEQLSGSRQVYDANEKLRDQMNSMSEDQKGLANIYKNTFSSMSDAIVEFARTGKLNFKSLINDMLAQILRLYMNKMFMNLFSSILPSLPGMGTSTFSGSSVGFGIPSGVPMAKGGAFSDIGLMKYAMGGVFTNRDVKKYAMGGAFTDTDVKKYAKGGTFTNSIVDQPTMFKFAKGTGLMGEAGPEAIMPLKRDSQGNLGVRGGSSGGNVEVVVNNYSTEKAEARETVDSRGNRRVEVVVGDMTAGEIARGGSMTNRSIRSTFGLQPQLIRR